MSDRRFMKLRWRIAEWRGGEGKPTCWAALVSWALYGGWLRNRDDHTLRPPITPCIADAERKGSCYCGKVRDDRSASGSVGSSP